MEGESKTAAVKLVESFEKLAREGMPTQDAMARNNAAESPQTDVTQSAARSQPRLGSFSAPVEERRTCEDDSNMRVNEGPTLDEQTESSPLICGFGQSAWCKSKPCKPCIR